MLLLILLQTPEKVNAFSKILVIAALLADGQTISSLTRAEAFSCDHHGTLLLEMVGVNKAGAEGGWLVLEVTSGTPVPPQTVTHSAPNANKPMLAVLLNWLKKDST